MNLAMMEILRFGMSGTGGETLKFSFIRKIAKAASPAFADLKICWYHSKFLMACALFF